MNLLLVMPNFFNYPRIIKEELEHIGYNVDFFDDRPSTNAFVKAVIRIKPNLIKWYINRYFKTIKRHIEKKEYDIVFFISGQSLSLDEKMIGEIKRIQPNAKYILYQWDSLNNFPYIAKMHCYFDEIYSFDRKDCENNKKIQFLPLFYCKRYEEIGKHVVDKYKYDFSFVGTAHPQKYKFIKLMSEQLKAVYSKQFIYFFFPSPIVYWYRKIKNPEFRKACRKEFHFTPLSSSEVDEVFVNSRCILDAPQAGQDGLTIRVIEALGAKRKLITTNADVMAYDFYKPENIYVYDGEIDLSNVFFRSKYVEVETNVYEKYSLNSWLLHMLH